MAITMDRIYGSGASIYSDSDEYERGPEVFVIYTTHSSTHRALNAAARVASGRNARIRILVPQIVPYPLPLDRPEIDPAHLERKFTTAFQDSEMSTTVDILPCRDPWDAIHLALPSPSVVVIAGRSGWWPSAERAIARRLRKEGHHVVVTGGE